MRRRVKSRKGKKYSRSRGKKKTYRKSRGKKYARTPYPSVYRVCLNFVDIATLNAGSVGGSQELVYSADDIYDCDTQAGVQSSAYFQKLMKEYAQWQVDKSKIVVKVVYNGGNVVNGHSFIVTDSNPNTISTSANQISLLSNQTMYRSKLATVDSIQNDVAYNRATYKHKMLKPNSAFTDQTGTVTANNNNRTFYHWINYPMALGQSLPSLTVYVKIKYYCTFFYPVDYNDVYNS